MTMNPIINPIVAKDPSLETLNGDVAPVDTNSFLNSLS